MEERGFDSNKGSIKASKKMKGKYCLQPFANVDIHSNHGVRCCSESWMPTWIGDMSKNSIEELWNMETIQDIRRTILDGSYSYCDYHQCPFYSNDEHYLYTQEELENPEGIENPVRKKHLIKNMPWAQYILDGKTKVDKMPANYNMAYDETCNLACPSCRSDLRLYTQGEEFDNRMAIQEKLLSEVVKDGMNDGGRFNVSGSGEAFISKVFTDFLYNFDGSLLPKMDVNIQSNGVLFTETAWNKMEKIHDNINEVLISLDAAQSDTYKTIRVNGNFDKLIQNLEFLAKRRAEGKINRLMLAYVVQKSNVTEMIDAIKIAKRLNVDFFVFNLLNDWGSWTKEEYEANAIWKEYHPQFDEFLQILRDPIFLDPLLDLGNMLQYRNLALEKFGPLSETVELAEV